MLTNIYLVNYKLPIKVVNLLTTYIDYLSTFSIYYFRLNDVMFDMISVLVKDTRGYDFGLFLFVLFLFYLCDSALL